METAEMRGWMLMVVRRHLYMTYYDIRLEVPGKAESQRSRH